MKNKKVYLFILFFLSSSGYFAKEKEEVTVVINDQLNLQMIGKKLYFKQDPTGKLTIDDILNHNINSKFQLNSKDIFINRPSPSAFWFKINIENLTEKEIWLEVGSTFLWNIDYYGERKGKYELITSTGVLRPEKSKARPLNLFWLPLLSSKDLQTVYIRIHTLRPIEIPFRIGTEQSLNKEKKIYDFITIGFIGFMVAMFFYNLFLLFSTKDKLYLIYIGYVITSIPVSLFLNNFQVVDFISNEFLRQLLHKSPLIWLNLPVIFAGIFTIFLLQLDNKIIIKRIIQFYLIYFSVIMPSLDLFEIFPHNILVQPNQIITVSYMFLLLFVGLFMWLKEKNRNAIFYSLAWVWPIFGLICFYLTVNDIIEYNYITRSSILLGIGVETLIFSLALADRINIIRKEKELVQAKNLLLASAQNQLLEMTIKERTSELIRTGEILEQTNQVARIGSWEIDLTKENAGYWSKVTREIHDVEIDRKPILDEILNFYKEGESRNKIKNALRKLIENKVSFDLELQMITAKQREIWVRVIGQAEFEANECKKIFGTFQDIDVHKKQELETIEIRHQMEAALDSTADGILIASVNGNILKYNTRLKSMFSDSDEANYNKSLSFHEIISKVKNSKESEIQFDPKFFDSPESNFDILELKDGRIFEQYSKPMSIEKKIVGRVWSFRDITTQKIANESLIQAKEIAELANRSKSEFLSNMSHEIRTPLNGVIGFTDLMQGTKLDESQQLYMKTINQSATKLLDLVNNILDFSKIEAGKIELNIDKVNLVELINQSVKIVKFQIKEKSIELFVNYSKPIDELIWVDPIRLRQILINLLLNAVKFTDKGKIEINVKMSKSYKRETENEFTFSIQDTGKGISNENRMKIFDAFSQEDTSITRKYGGTGLGLTICNQLLALMNSKLELESELGIGSNFYFKLLAKSEKFDSIEKSDLQNNNNSSAKLQSELPTSLAKKKKVLIVDDNSVNLLLIKSIISRLIKDIEIFEAVNGKDAIEKFKEKKPDIIFMDLQMPVLNGYEATIAIRNLEYGKSLPIIAITAGSVSNEKEKCMQVGMNGFATKPIDNTIISQILNEWLIKDDLK